MISFSKKWFEYINNTRFMRYNIVLTILLIINPLKSIANVLDSHVQSKEELEYGVVLFEFFQNNFFSAMVENEFTEKKFNGLSISDEGQLLKGSMMLSYGLSEGALAIFQNGLSGNYPEEIKNKAWYYLSYYYYKSSNLEKALEMLNNIKNSMPKDLYFDYYYLATLLKKSGYIIPESLKVKTHFFSNHSLYHYLLFNLAMSELESDNEKSAMLLLEKVSDYSGDRKEYVLLADRAKLGMSQIAIQSGNFVQAWEYLQNVRTTGLYSNRALLSYAWTAIKLRKIQEAVAALEVLNGRSIANPEVQEAKVLLSHLYEQEGFPKKALKANIDAIESFEQGLVAVDDARKLMSQKNMANTFVNNVNAVSADENWRGHHTLVDYKKLTPFLIDLMASNEFHQSLIDLSDLYALRNNLDEWLLKTDEHILILENSSRKKLDAKAQSLFEASAVFGDVFLDQKSELDLLSLTLTQKDQDRMSTILNATEKEVKRLNEKIEYLKQLTSAYELPQEYKYQLAEMHNRLTDLRNKTLALIVDLEPLMKDLINAELNTYTERMQYYTAQSRLAKIRLYDTALSDLQDPEAGKKDVKGGGK